MTEELDVLSALAWLVEAGADEAVGDAPVDRFQAKAATASAKISPSPLAGEGKANARVRSHWEGGESRNRTPPPPSGFAARPLPQGEGGNATARFAPQTATRKP